MDIEHKRRYLKYKKKYLELKQSGGNPNLEQFLNQYGIDTEEESGYNTNLRNYLNKYGIRKTLRGGAEESSHKEAIRNIINTAINELGQLQVVDQPVEPESEDQGAKAPPATAAKTASDEATNKATDKTPADDQPEQQTEQPAGVDPTQAVNQPVAATPADETATDETPATPAATAPADDPTQVDQPVAAKSDEDDINKDKIFSLEGLLYQVVEKYDDSAVILYLEDETKNYSQDDFNFDDAIEATKEQKETFNKVKDAKQNISIVGNYPLYNENYFKINKSDLSERQIQKQLKIYGLPESGEQFLNIVDTNEKEHGKILIEEMKNDDGSYNATLTLTPVENIEFYKFKSPNKDAFPINEKTIVGVYVLD